MVALDRTHCHKSEFDATVGLTGLIVTKLDGTAKAGVLFAIASNPYAGVFRRRWGNLG
jgi:signal recognition particle GTPase